jgi:hypothetical protein
MSDQKTIEAGIIKREEANEINRQNLRARGYHINPPDFAHLLGWNHILFHLHMAKFSLKNLQIMYADRKEIYEDPNSEIIHTDMCMMFALLVAYLMNYGKCFASTESRAVKLDDSKVFKEKEILKVLHDRIMHLRNTYAAHTTTSDLLTSTIAVREYSNEYYVIRRSGIFIPVNELDGYMRTLIQVEDYTSRRISWLTNKLSTKKGKSVRLYDGPTNIGRL